MHRPAAVPKQPSVVTDHTRPGGPMRLFGRKRSDDEIEEPCPHCGEPVPEGAVECMMCGVDLRPLRGVPGSERAEPPKTDSPVR